ncbi:hypothetical protein BDY24DRAFT_270396 [Mrakia frigida]|uniref:uncharacterized protein n=1 Tax=Mrakia frigida TaxID=29902 RepID=UPI003FCBF400
MNLASNAIKFTPEGGSIVVRWKIEPRDSTQTLVKVSVADTGVGIPPHKMDRLFKSFSQIDSSITRSYGGSGLGLAISQSLARLMGGSCSAKSIIGTGSTFSFSFLVSTQDASKTEQPFPSFPPGRNAFVLARPGTLRRTVEEELTTFGITSDGEESISKASSKLASVQYSILLVDSRLVSSDDVKHLVKIQPNGKIIFLSAIAQLSSTIDRLNIKHAETLLRPLRTSALYDAVAPVSAGTSTALPQKPKLRSEIDPELKYPLSILLVDDNRVNCLVGARILERFGYTDIQTAFDGLEAVEKAEANGSFDLVLLDLQMPVLDGYKANARIASSALTGKPCVVALSANTDDVTMDQVHRESFTAYLSKPLSIPALAETLVMVHGLRQLERRKSSSNFSS